ncbi:MAG: hypothetical protein ACI9F9_001942 [Candidatus Paceibacteria bacterium]|jgi:hypothetical protein
MTQGKWIRTLALATAVTLGGVISSPVLAGTAGSNNDQAQTAQRQTMVDALTAPNTGSDWIVKSENAICGVSEAHQITNPAKVDYDALMSATEEMKELRKKRIDKTSARGQTLVAAARDRVRRATSSVMKAKGHCSVWKKISHKKGTVVTDLTKAIKAKITT